MREYARWRRLFVECRFDPLTSLPFDDAGPRVAFTNLFAGLPLALRTDLNYNSFTFKEDLPFSTGGTGGTITTTSDITQQVLGGLANISIPFHMGPVSPYITAGLAGFHIKTKLSDAIEGAEDKSDTKFAVNGAWVFR